MKRLFLIALGCALYAAGVQAQISVTGNLKNLGVQNITGGNTYVRFTLENYAGALPVVVNSNLVVIDTQDFKPDPNGNISGSIQPNDTIVPSGTYYQVCVYFGGTRFRCNNYSITNALYPSGFNLNTATPIVITPPTSSVLTGARSYLYIQTTPSSSWTIVHNLNDPQPNIQCSDGTIVLYPDRITYVDLNTIIVGFPSNQTGKCRVITAGALNLAQGVQNVVLQSPTGDQTIPGPYNLNLGGSVNFSGPESHTGSGTTGVLGLGAGALNANNTWVGSDLFITFQCVTLENIICVDPANSQGWGGSDYGAWVMSAIASLPTVNGYKSGQVMLAPSISVVTQSSGVTITSPFVVIKGPGAGALQISCTYNGNCWDVHVNPFVIWPGGQVSGFSIVGQGTSNANAVGFHVGDVLGATFEDLAIDNFRGANSACIWMDNVNGFTEGNVFKHITTGLAEGAQNGCTKDWKWTNTGNTANTSSFAHNHYLANHYTVFNGQTAFSMEGGNHAIIEFNFTGNSASGSTATIFSLSGFTFGANPTQATGTFNLTSECTTPCTTATLMNVAAGANVFILGGDGFNDTSALMTSSISGNVIRALNDSLNGGVETTWIYGQSFSGNPNAYILNPANPAANRQISITDPGGSDTFAWLNAIQTFTGKTFSDAITSTLATGTAPLTVSSTTPVTNLTTVPTTYNHSGAQQTNVHIVEDSDTLSSASPSTKTITLNGSSVFTSNATYNCTVTNKTTQANPLKVAYTNGSTFVVTGPNTVSDAFSYICVGN